MKGIILAGGLGTRLYPITQSINKHLLPIYDKPMIYYPLSILMMAKIRDIVIISTPEHVPIFKKFLGDGKKYGCSFSYLVQKESKGIAQALLIAEEFIGKDDFCLILGDNIFYESGLIRTLENCKNPEGGIIFAYRVSNPEEYGVIELDKNFNAISIEEKPKNPKSNYAIPGLYFYNSSVIEIAKKLKPSYRGEYEITDLNKELLTRGILKVIVFGRGTAWLDTGTFDSFIESSNFVRTIEKRQGLKIGCIEEIAYKNGWISEDEIKELAKYYMSSGYGKYVLSIIKRESD